MSTFTSSDAAKAVVRRNTEEVQSHGNSSMNYFTHIDLLMNTSDSL
jgi:hypothetical protein